MFFFNNSYFLLLIFQLCFWFLFIFPGYRRRNIQQASCFYLEGFNFVCYYTCFFLNNNYFFLLIFITLFLVSFYFPGLSTKKHHAGKFFSLLLLCMFVSVLFVSICKVLILFVVMHVFFLIIVIFSYWFFNSVFGSFFIFPSIQQTSFFPFCCYACLVNLYLNWR